MSSFNLFKTPHKVSMMISIFLMRKLRLKDVTEAVYSHVKTRAGLLDPKFGFQGLCGYSPYTSEFPEATHS